jgi:hypothetical protein
VGFVINFMKGYKDRFFPKVVSPRIRGVSFATLETVLRLDYIETYLSLANDKLTICFARMFRALYILYVLIIIGYII